MTDLATPQPSATAEPPAPDRRDNRAGLATLLARPEFGALIAAVAIFVFFSVVADPFLRATSLATVLYSSSQLGIIAVAVGLLMIGGEFDLSAGVTFATAALSASMLCYNLHLNMIAGGLISMAICLLIGFINGLLVMRTGIPSFLITLGTFFILQGANLGVTKAVTGSVATQDIRDIQGYTFMKEVFAHTFRFGDVNVPILVFYWIAFVVLATWILVKTRIGNWIFAVGGNAASARAVGVPVARVKIGLFMAVSFLAWFYGMHTLFQNNTVQAGTGVGQEFFLIIAVVVGGTLLTGGYGSAVGAFIGALIFGMVSNGIVYAGWDPNWFKAFLGVMLLLAVMVNLYVRNVITRRK